jgi:hypothetical protein
VSFSCSFFSLCSFFVILIYLCFIELSIVFVMSVVIMFQLFPHSFAFWICRMCNSLFKYCFFLYRNLIYFLFLGFLFVFRCVLLPLKCYVLLETSFVEIYICIAVE